MKSVKIYLKSRKICVKIIKKIHGILKITPYILKKLEIVRKRKIKKDVV